MELQIFLEGRSEAAWNNETDKNDDHQDRWYWEIDHETR